jgi:type III secretion protein O
MAYLLQPLLSIRKMREDRAAGELTAARRAVHDAEETLEARKKELADFEKTKDERRDRIYDAIMGHPVTREQIDLANEGVARIDQEEALRTDNMHRADADLKEREKAADAARAVFAEATRNRMKIDEHKAVWNAAEALDAERRAEGELEDFTVRKLEL